MPNGLLGYFRKEIGMNLLTELRVAWDGIFQQLFPYAIQFLWISILLFAGWFVAHALRNGVSYIAKEGHLDRAASEIGLTPVLTRGEMKRPVSTLLGDMVYWMVMLLSFLTVVGAFQIASPAHILRLVFGYMTNALGAVVLLGVAIYFAVFLHRVVLLVVNNVGLSYAKPLARIAQYTVIGLSLITAVSILGIQTDWFIGSLHVLVVASALALAIALGSGGREMASHFLTRLFKS